MEMCAEPDGRRLRPRDKTSKTKGRFIGMAVSIRRTPYRPAFMCRSGSEIRHLRFLILVILTICELYLVLAVARRILFGPTTSQLHVAGIGCWIVS